MEYIILEILFKKTPNADYLQTFDTLVNMYNEIALQTNLPKEVECGFFNAMAILANMTEADFQRAKRLLVRR